jgi:hypothetical protein
MSVRTQTVVLRGRRTRPPFACCWRRAPANIPCLLVDRTLAADDEPLSDLQRLALAKVPSTCEWLDQVGGPCNRPCNVAVPCQAGLGSP